jgi:hypothetical protein
MHVSLAADFQRIGMQLFLAAGAILVLILADLYIKSKAKP